ncbi:site-2 protease family protein [Adhaeretor mobilis]|uniref:Peptidase family M50 n=1 Tax=Adhaeretor mobilis TaxID=1930276 RepID=A0A517N2N6_9BACT|nr:site-2 protease family protein [Adhaeretor mobilis]QDT01397.1 Peptidase family M50 [Adhaeretor mobilis]
MMEKRENNDEDPSGKEPVKKAQAEDAAQKPAREPAEKPAGGARDLSVGDSLAPGPAKPPAGREPAADDPFLDPVYAHLPELKASDLYSPPPVRQRRTLLPILLFLATCLSTYYVGAADWMPDRSFGDLSKMLAVMANNWRTGLQYMVAVLAILLTHEMGHFIQTVKYGISASYPMCIPVPFNPIGTMGAVIGMDGMRADRRQIFDIGIAGPLAGLVVAVPVFWWGIGDLKLGGPTRPDELKLYLPVLGSWMLDYLQPQWAGTRWIPLSQVNPYFMAGWVGMLITGLNMLPVSQLDGGHTIYALFLDRAHTIAKVFTSFCIAYIVFNLDHAVMWTPMLILVILMGIQHPKTANDKIDIGEVRWWIGIASLSIPVLCFPILGFTM